VPEARATSQKLLSFDTFEQGMGQWVKMGGGAQAVELARERDSERGDYCLRMRQTVEGATFGAYARSAAFNPATYPIISFDYKVPPGVYADLTIYVNQQWFTIKFTAPRSVYRSIGDVPGVKADGNWHTVWFNLYEMLQKAEPSATSYEVRHLGLADFGANNNRTGATLWVDNFAVLGDAEAQPSAAGGFQWSSVDITGIKGYSYTFDASPWSMPDTVSEGADGKCALPPVTKPGMYYFHVRAQDNAGNWGVALHHPYYVAAVPPPRP